MPDNSGSSFESRLKVEKLRLEVKSMQRALRPWYSRPSLVVSSIGATAAFLAVLIQWRVTAVQVDIAEWKAGKAEERAAELKQDAEEIGQDLEDLRSVASSLELEIANLKSERDSLLADILLDETASDGLLKSARAVITGTYKRQKDELDELNDLFLPEMNIPLMHGVVPWRRIESITTEIENMEKLWPWLKGVEEVSELKRVRGNE